MFTSDQYQLIDFGDGRRLERFAALRLDRPAAAVEDVRRSSPGLWTAVDARFDRTGAEGTGAAVTGDNEGHWSPLGELPEQWTIAHGPIRFELKRTPAGHLGVFPEQADNWDWIAGEIGRSAQPAKIVNLFAYTGGSTLAAAAAGAEVTHVDAARNTVAWARRNAELSGMAELPIRWIAEDAMKFVKRELKRGNRYDAAILDPPSYGHGPRGEVWRLSKDLPRLLELCTQLTAPRRRFILLTCHTPGYDPQRLKRMMAEAMGDTGSGTVESQPLAIRSATGREFPSGVVVHWRSQNCKAATSGRALLKPKP